MRPGETLDALHQPVTTGGKGMNQTVALAKAGAAVCHAGCVGQGGGMLRQTLESYGVDTAYLKETETLQGNAVIQVGTSAPRI